MTPVERHSLSDTSARDAALARLRRFVPLAAVGLIMIAVFATGTHRHLSLDTLVRHRVPVVSVVGNNGIWALEKHTMERMLGTSLLADLTPGTRYDQVVEALGGYGEVVDRPEAVGPALERAFRSGLPACVNVICDPKAEYPRSSVLT